MIIDAHQHFWRYNDREYDWMEESQGVLKRDHLPDELAGLMARAGVSGTVAVQARRTVAETEWLLGLGGRHDFILGVVGWVDFDAAHLETTLERLSANPLLKGVRELIHDMPDPDYATSAGHVFGVRAAHTAGLAYDLLLKPEHLKPATSLVDLLPEQRFVVDHIAKPDIAGGRLEPWAHDLHELSRRPNVHCKLSGMVTEAGWRGSRAGQVRTQRQSMKHPQAQTFTPYMDIVLAAFGTSRVMLGSDWPVCTCAADYGATIDIGREYVMRLSEDEQQRVLAGNAIDFYRLEVPAVRAAKAGAEAGTGPGTGPKA